MAAAPTGRCQGVARWAGAGTEEWISMELKGAMALVTGAAHRLGRAMARCLADRGCGVVIHYGRSRRQAEEAVEEMRGLGVESLCLPADLEDPAAIDSLFGELDRRLGRLDILVNSAASFEHQAFATIDCASWDRVLALNLRAPLLCSQRAAKRMIESRRPGGSPGLIVNLGDLSGVHPWPGYVQHGVSKAGLLHLTRIAARELGPGVRVNAVVPGAVLPPTGMEAESEEWLKMGESLPVHRTGSPAQIGETVVFLASNDFINGEVVFVDGGEHLLGAGYRASP